MAKAGRWSHIYISRETVNEIRNLSKMSDEVKAKLGIDLERVLVELRKKTAIRKPVWRTFMEGELGRLRENHYFEEQVLDRAKGYFEAGASKKLLKGHLKEELFYASLYLAVRMLQIPLKLSDITKISDLKSNRIMNSYNLLVRELNLNPPLLNPIKIVSHYAKNLKIKRRTLKKAVSIIEKAKEEGANSGKDPFSTAATATYLACLAENEKITQEEISNVFGVTSVTIRNNSKKLKKFIKQK